MNNQTLEKLRQMRLFGMHDAFKTSLENTIKEKMTQDQFVSHLVHCEWDNRKNRAVERAVRAAQSVITQHWMMSIIPSSGVSTVIRSNGLRLWSSYATTKTLSLRDRQERAKAILQRHSDIKPARTDLGCCTPVRPN